MNIYWGGGSTTRRDLMFRTSGGKRVGSAEEAVPSKVTTLLSNVPRDLLTTKDGG